MVGEGRGVSVSLHLILMALLKWLRQGATPLSLQLLVSASNRLVIFLGVLTKYKQFYDVEFNLAGPCKTMKWGTCDGNPCTCTLLVGTEPVKLPINCDQCKFLIFV